MATVGRWSVFAGYLGLTFFLSHQPDVPGASAVPDYLLHIAEFSLLSILLLRALSARILGPHSRRALLATFLFGAIYGIVDELHQSFVPGRSSSTRDAAIDAAASGLTVAGIAGLGEWRSRRSRNSGPPLNETIHGSIGTDIASVRGSRPRVEMLTREGCHLCDQAREVLIRMVGAEGRDWNAIDIASDPALEQRYGREIPVVFLDGVKRFKGRIDPVRLARLLAEPGRLREGS